jgi:hypothetical protein
MLGNSWVAAQLAASQEGLSSMELVSAMFIKDQFKTKQYYILLNLCFWGNSRNWKTRGSVSKDEEFWEIGIILASYLDKKWKLCGDILV